MAAVASPVMGPVSDLVVSTVGDSILVEIPMHAGFDLATKLANDLVFEKPINHVLPIYSKRLETTHVKTMLITLKYKHTIEDAALGFYRGSVHKYVPHRDLDPSSFDFSETPLSSRTSRTTCRLKKDGFHRTSSPAVDVLSSHEA